MSKSRAGSALTDEGVNRVVELIRPCFDKYVAKYDLHKYPPETYEDLLVAFREPEQVTDGDLRKAVIWKFGHIGKRRIPQRHEALISSLQSLWPGLSPTLIGSATQAFTRLTDVLGRAHRFITLAFLLHLMRPTEIPIIDRHNFRAMNHYFRAVRPEWRPKSAPSTFDDLVILSTFVSGIRSCWETVDPATVPSVRNLDRFLMMYGKIELQQRKRQSATSRATDAGSSSSAGRPRGPRDTDAGTSVRLPHGGTAACFHVSRLVQYVKESGREYIIQGQANCAFSAHRKQHSLNFWLRQNFAVNRDTKQAVNDVVEQLVLTGLFETGEFLCPDSGRRCKGIRLVTSEES